MQSLLGAATLSVLGIVLPVLLLGLVLHWVMVRKMGRWSSLPGPWSPLVFLLISARNSNNVIAWRQTYKKYQKGGVCFIPLMNIPLMFVGDFKKLKFLFNHPDVQGRVALPDGQLYKFLYDYRSQKAPGDSLVGLFLSQGETWKQQRRFTVKTLGDFGFGKSSMEEMVWEEVEKFCESLSSRLLKPVQVSGLFNISILNILWRMTTGATFAYDDVKIKQFSYNLAEFLSKAFGRPDTVFSIVCPWITKVFPHMANRKRYKDGYAEVSKMMYDLIESHKETHEKNNPTDFIDCYLTEILNTKDPHSSFYKETGEENLATLLIDIFIGGDDTVPNVLNFGLLFMVRNPEVLKRVQLEIDLVLGTNCPKLEDRDRLHYTQATIMEVLRKANTVPHGGFRSTTADIIIDEFKIPKDTMIFPIFAEVLKGDFWDKGECFNPSRFLDKNGVLKQEEQLIPFSIGKRSCPGQKLANVQLFLYFTRIVQMFNFCPVEDNGLPEETFTAGIASTPTPFELIFSSRVNNLN